MSDSMDIVPPSSEFSECSEASLSTEKKIKVLDYRSKFSKVVLEYTPNETLQQVLERAHLDAPVEAEQHSIKVFVQASSSTVSAEDLGKTLEALGLAGTVTITVENKAPASGENMARALAEYSANVEGIQPFGVHTSGGSSSLGAASPSPASTPLTERRDTGDVDDATTISSSGGVQDVQMLDESPCDAPVDSPVAQSPSPMGSPAVQPQNSPSQEIPSMSIAAAAAAAAVTRKLRHVESKGKGINDDDDDDIPVGPSLKTLWMENKCAAEPEESYNTRSRTGFAGLCNQGATCYLNSLVQALYMSPEFRNAVYAWSFEAYFEKALRAKREKNPDMTEQQVADFRRHTERMSVPFQLQMLFAQMQLTQARAVSTRNLTTSFGWEAADAFTQHDAIELCQVLLDALEKAMAGTEQVTLIDDIFKGVMCDYVHCLGCQHENARHDPFLDVPLVIKGFGETHAVKSVEEALRKFITPEVLDENNLYNCEACGNKCRAVKGLRFERFPYIVMLQMKRFDFDYSTMDRIKLCDRVSFPYTLDLADYIEGGKVDKEVMEKATSCEKHNGDETVMKNDDEKDDEGEDKMKDEPEKEEKEEDEETTEMTQEEEEEEKKEEEEKSSGMLYDLYAILIHSGSANGGHYYAYIKDYRSGKWFQFNDSTVTEIGDADIKQVFGRDSDSDSNSWYSQNAYYRRSSCGVTAYMLMYRRIDKERNALPCADEDVPAKLREYMEKQNAENAERERLAKLARETHRLTVTYNSPTGITTMFFDEHESKTVEEVKKEVLKAFECTANPEDARLVLIDRYMGTKEPLNDSDTLKMCGVCSWKKDMELETKEPGEQWVVWNPNAISVHVFYQPPEERSEDKDGELSFTSVEVSVDKTERVEKLRATVAELVGITPEKLRLLLRVNTTYASGEFSETLFDGTALDRNDVSDGCDIYVEVCDTPNERATADNSAVFRYLDDLGNQAWYTLSCTDGRTFPITIDQRLPLRELKARVGEIVGIPPNRVVLKRGNQSYKTELVDMEESLRKNYIYKGDTLFVEEGLMGSHEVGVALWVPEENAYRRLFQMTVVESDPVKDVTEQVRAKYNETYGSDPAFPHSDDPACFVLRGYDSGYFDRFPDAISDGALPLKKAVVYFSPATVLVVQVLPKPQPVAQDTMLVYCYEWHPAAVCVDPVATELFVSKKDTINDLRRALAAIHKPAEGSTEESAAEVRAEDICVALPSSQYNLKPPSINEMVGTVDQAPEWADGETETIESVSKRMYVHTGTKIAFWNGAEPLGLVDESKKEQQTSAPAAQHQNKAAAPVAWNNSPAWHRKEASIKIRTSDSDDEDTSATTKGTPAATTPATPAEATEPSNDNDTTA